MRVEIQRGANRIAVDGTLDEIRAILAAYWDGHSTEARSDEKSDGEPKRQKGGSAAKPRGKKRATSQSKGTPVGSTTNTDVNAFVNGMKDRADYELIENTILNGKDRWRKIRLIYGIADSELTTGDVHKILEALEVKMSLGGVSTVVNKNIRSLFTSETRKPGASPKYRLTGTAKAEFRKDIEGLGNGTD